MSADEVKERREALRAAAMATPVIDFPAHGHTLADYSARAITYLLALATAYRMAPTYGRQDWASARLYDALAQECARYQVPMRELLDATRELAPLSEHDETLLAELDE